MDDFELISAYLDDALEPDAKAMLAARLTHEPKLAATLNALRASDDTLRSAFEAPMHDPMPQRFLDLLAAKPASASDNVINLADHIKGVEQAANDNPRRWRWIGGAIAASLAVGLFVSTQFSGSGANDKLGDMVAFNAALDKTPSLQRASLSNGKTLTPQLSFASRDGTFCRQFSVTGAASSQDGVACRAGGKWKVEALLPGIKPTAGDGEFETAGGAGNEKLDAVIAKLRASDPLGAAAEQRLIADGWDTAK
jgi:negative regulator of sigma E activity